MKRAEARAPFALRLQSLALIPALVLALFIGFANQACAAWDYGNGRHGSYVLTTNATIEQLYQTVRLTNDPTEYNPADSNAIPNFQNLIITNGATLTANSWNGSTGGIIVLKVQNTLAIAAGAYISVNGIGYRGGGSLQQGESYAGSQSISSSPNYGGGGGSNCGGAGGGFGTGGTAGCGSYGGGTYGMASLSTVYLGSGGGGGNGNINGSGGGFGGGAIILNAGYLNVQGGIQAGGGSGNSFIYYGGGGGSGGSILMNVASGVIGTNNVIAVGGSGSQYAGSGGVGRIAAYYAESFTGATTPTAYILNDTNSDTINITNQPASQSIFLGSNVLFNVGFSTLSPHTMQWYFNGAPIPSATNQSLSLFYLSLTNQGNYWLTISNVVMAVNSSNVYLTVLDTNMPFGDSIPNWWKTQYGLSLSNSTLATNHPAGDQLTYLQKYLYGLNPVLVDNDGDGLTDYDEIFIYHTNPLLTDTDGDGIPDGWEVLHGLNPLVNDATQIGIAGVSNLQIYQYDLSHTNQLDPRNPFFAPGTSIYEVLNNGQHTNRIYYDRDDRLVGEEFSRGLSIAYKYDGNGNPIRQTYLSRASETNGLPVLWRFLNGLTNNTSTYADSDGDGWTDYQEWQAGTDPNNATITPNSLGNPGTNIASLVLPFTPSNFVVGAGQLDGTGAEEVVVGADGNPGTNINFLLVLTQTSSGWSTQRVDVGSFGVTSIAVGQLTNRPSSAIYAGLRGTTNGSGCVMEFIRNGGIWVSSVVALSTNQAAFVLGVSGQNILLNLATTNAASGTLNAATFFGTWNVSLLDTNTSQRGLETLVSVHTNQVSLRLLDSGGIQVSSQRVLPTNAIYSAAASKWYFLTPSSLTWLQAQAYAQEKGGNLATVTDAAFNTWVTANFFQGSGFWIGLSRASCCSPPATCGWQWSSGSPFGGYYNWGIGQPDCFGGNEQYVQVYLATGEWNDHRPDFILPGVVEISRSSPLRLVEPAATHLLNWRGLSMASGFLRGTNGSSIFYSFADDKNANGLIDFGDDFVTAEYLTTGTNTSLLIPFRQPITSVVLAQSYGLASVNFLNVSTEVFFTGEPDGRIFAWTTTGTTNSLQRQLFSAQHKGKAWHALTGVKTLEPGEGIAGLRVDPTNQNRCDVIFWSPQAQLPQLANVPQTAPAAAVIPSANPLGNVAVVNIRLWDNEGNAATPFLQYQLSGSTNWQNATLTALDGTNYNPATRVAALPTGVNHTLAWNAANDLGAGIVTNILLRARAQDFSLVGDWSSPTPFVVNMTQDSNTNGIPDWWEMQKFGSLQPANGDYDGDGFSNYAEYIADTNPNDSNSNLRITKIQPVSGGIAVIWQGGVNSTQYLQQRFTLNPTSSWFEIFTNLPPTPTPNGYTNYGVTNKSGFYRIRVTR